VIIMASTCGNCGSKYSEVKSGGETKAMGCKLTLKIEDDFDMVRDVVKSDTCSLCIPHLELEAGSRVLSSRFTTVEGILQAIRDQLEEQSHILLGGDDTADEEMAAKFKQLFQRLDDMIALKEQGTILVLDDPAGNSYIETLTALGEDNRLEKDLYHRSHEQNEELGLNDKCVEQPQVNLTSWILLAGLALLLLPLILEASPVSAEIVSPLPTNMNCH